MNILYVTNQLDVGGIEKNLVLLAQELTRRGHSVFAITRGGALVPEFEAAGGNHICHPVSPRPTGLIATSRLIRRICAEVDIDLVHAFSAPSVVAAVIARGRNGPPLVSSVMGLQNSPEEMAFKTYLRTWLTCVGATKVVVMAPAIADVIHRLPVSRKRLVYASVVGVEIPDEAAVSARRRAAREQLGVADDELLVLTIGRLDPRKSHEFFVRAAGLVLREAPKTRFAIIGDGPLRNSLQTEAAGLDGLEFLGERMDADRLVAGADVYVRPGVVEGFIGITALEAQASLVPVISFETEDVKLAIEDGQTGILVRRGDVHMMAAAIRTLLEDRTRSHQLAVAGRRHVTRLFSIEAIVDGLEEIYQGA